MLFQDYLGLFPTLPLAYYPTTPSIHVTKLGKTSIHCNVEMQYSRNRGALSNVLEVTRLPKSLTFVAQPVSSPSEDNVDGMGSIQKIWKGQRHQHHIYDGNAIDVHREEILGCAERLTA